MSTTQHIALGVISLFICAGIYRVHLRKDLTWPEFCWLLVSICIHPVHMVKAAFRRGPR